MSESHSFIVSQSLEGIRLLEFLATKLPLYSINTLKGLIEKGSVSVNTKRASAGLALGEGDEVAVSIPEGARRYEPHPVPLEVLFEDGHVLAVNKPTGLAVIPERGEIEATLIGGLLHYLQNLSPLSRGKGLRPRLVHRLDKDTSGVLLVAKDPEAERHLSGQFEGRVIEKEYVALVDGRVEREEATINLPLEETTRGKMRPSPRGKGAVTQYRIQERFNGFTLLKLMPKTGRTHQIRVHLKAIGHPLSIDPLYGNRSAIFLSSLKADYKPKKGQTETPIISRLTLHAHKITFEPLPGVGKMTVEAPMAEDMDRLIRVLRKYKGSG
ncbi:MAG TPA: RluA family pseudouridine synthase [Candidatus Brocadiales bacterium]|nr:RluA family pseudouridine synthase [Candidatus Brocadiales bacterium]